MHSIIIGSYLAAAAGFLAVTMLLALAWRGQRTGARLIVATAVSTAWAMLLAGAEWTHGLNAAWLMLAEVLRYGAWLAFLGAVFAPSRALRGLRRGAHGLWLVLAAYCLWPASGLARVTGVSLDIHVTLVGVLLLALIGVVLLEQILRNAEPDRRWALKFLLLSLGGMFAYDIFLYSGAMLYRQFDTGAWAARGYVDALLAPLLLVAAARNRRWSLRVGVSRRVVFYSTSLLAVACYLLAVAVGGYYVRRHGGDWGRVAEIALIFLALLSAALLIGSGSARSRLRVFLHKNFFSYRYDYREQWLRLTATLAASADDGQLPVRAVRALAQIMDSPGGLLMQRDESDCLVPAAAWNMPLPERLSIAVAAPECIDLCQRQWIHDLDDGQGASVCHPPAELAALPSAWLLVPLVLDGALVGVVVLARARARRRLDWEDIDLLRTAGSQIAGTLVQAGNARALAQARQFEGFNRLTAFLMHDLKNVTAQQSLLLRNAERHKHNPAFIDDMLATVEHSVQRIERLLEQLRGEGEAVLPGRVSLIKVIERALAQCRTQRPVPGWETSGEALWVRADADQLTSVLVHLIGNAQDAAGAEGRVRLRLIRADRQAVLEVIDDGVGMDAAFVRERLFQPFYTTKGSRGMGMGAYQARACARALGGSLDVDSAPGRGSAFRLRLPLAAAPDATVAAVASMEAAS